MWYVLYTTYMKYYETSYEDYVQAATTYNMHPEIDGFIDNLPEDIHYLNNLMIYGASGTGKYTQVLRVINKYSQSELKYDKRITAITDKQQYKYRISDIHYEIDMAMLGCNSKQLWNEIFSQIIDIVNVKQSKVGIIVCKNFHMIHSELLETFYSYIQHYNHSQTNIRIIFFIITEHISFIPNNIRHAFSVLNVKRPSKTDYIHITKNNDNLYSDTNAPETFVERIAHSKNKIQTDNNEADYSVPDYSVSDYSVSDNSDIDYIFSTISPCEITNVKETRSFPLLVREVNGELQTQVLPNDIFNIVCDQVLRKVHSIHANAPFNFMAFRDDIYNILTYHLDIHEVILYIITHITENKLLNADGITDIMQQTYPFFKYYNNNYRPIYHLESILLYMVNKLQGYNEL